MGFGSPDIWRTGALGVSLLAAVGPAGCGSGSAVPPASSGNASTTPALISPALSPPASPSPTAAPPHVMVIMEENSGYQATLGSCASGSPDPYLCSLAAGYASLTSWYGVEHPSQPNYIAIVSGSDQGCHADYCVGADAYSATDLGGQLTAAGIPWVAWMESMPSACYTGADHGSDSTGAYALKHNPFVVFRDDMPPKPCRIQPYPGAAAAVRALDGPGGPDFVWITPNLCNDGHDDCGPGNVRQTDSWLRLNLPGVLSSAWFADRGTVIITMDEGVSGSCCGQAAGGRIPEVVISAGSRGRGGIPTSGDHFGTLRSIEEAYGLPLLGAASDAANGDFSSLIP
ncbi:MAG: alkaline phosphatase family protein [Candidatus Dormiibacterota bacterium]